MSDKGLDTLIGDHLAELADSSNFGSLEELQGVLLGWSMDLRSGAQSLTDHLPVDGDSAFAAFASYIAREMPEGTLIGDPAWWAPRLWNYARYASRVAVKTAPAKTTTDHEREMEKALEERDANANYADQLTYMISVLLDQEMGEHTSGNFPWENAIEAMRVAIGLKQSPPKTPPDAPL
jgi:hypothetical protein